MVEREAIKLQNTDNVIAVVVVVSFSILPRNFPNLTYFSSVFFFVTLSTWLNGSGSNSIVEKRNLLANSDCFIFLMCSQNIIYWHNTYD